MPGNRFLSLTLHFFLGGVQAADEVNLRGDGQRKVSDLIQHFQEMTDEHK